MSYLIIGASLNPESHSQILAAQAQHLLQKQEKSSRWLDLREIDLPFCAGRATFDHPSLPPLNDLITQATGILVTTPIYNYDVNAALKNFVELTGRSWQEKTVGFICAAGGKASYMSVMPFANSLMLDFHCLIIPRFVYATKEAFVEGKLVDKDIEMRLTELINDFVRITEALNS